MNADLEKKRSAALGYLKSKGKHWTQRSAADLSWTAAATDVAQSIARERARLSGEKPRRERMKAVKP